MCYKQLLNEPEEKLYKLFDKYVAFEEELNCSEKRGLIFDMGKYLLMNRYYKLAKIYFRLLSVPKNKISTSPYIKNLVRKFV